MSHYRLDFISSLAAPATFAPRRTIWYGTEADLVAAKGDRIKRIYLVLLTEASVPYSLEANGGIRYDGDAGNGANMDLVASLWNDATLLVSTGRDLQ
ncbi:MAG: hypothetical protein EOR11_20110 [Mesorhizobium sp.]|uniref:hypothetical protein n=1 Tax=Mesorhizobium sp. TaxID=1871066 RepID=UPI000FE460B2|nr:hypothetical protein [Mesorhizobium sp.]RWP84767.1 MAG: hypothetical protein EOR11_20110 [Mesorhizobium sp.]